MTKTTRTRIVYHGDGSKSVLTDAKTYRPDYNSRTFDTHEAYHTHILNTYYELEQTGKLPRDHDARKKQRIADLHKTACDPRYWGE